MPFGTKSRDDPNEQRMPASYMKGAEGGTPLNGVRFRKHQAAWDQRYEDHGTGAGAEQPYHMDTDPHISGRRNAYGADMSQPVGYDPSRNRYDRRYGNTAAQDSGAYQYYGTKNDEYRNYGIPPRNDPQKRKPPRRGALAWVIVIGILLVAGGIFIAVNTVNNNNRAKALQELSDAVRPYDNKYCDGVYVNGVHLGGMTTDQAYAAVSAVLQQQNSVWRVRLTYNGTAMAEITADMLGLGQDSPQVYNAIAQTLNDAWLQGHTGTDSQRKASMDTLRNNPYMANVQMPTADTSVIEPILQQIRYQIETLPVDATVIAFDPNQATPFTYTPESNGLTLDIAPLERQLYEMISNHQAGEIVITPTVVAPNVRLEDLKKQHTLLASVSTDISTASAENRNLNIRRAMELLNGTIIQPGQQFSFNDVVGERTTKNGFLPAIEYAYNEHVEGIGGGVCQASSTVYQAAVKAGMQIIKRSPHSDSVSYAEYGKDATVYWVGKRKIDLVFKNNTDMPIYIVATVQNAPNSKKRLVTKVSIYGRDPGNVRYDLETKTIETLSIPEPEIIRDTDGVYAVYDDEMVQATNGKLGYVVESYQVQYTGKYETDRKLLYTDTYKAQAPKVYVGIQKRSYS